MLYDPKWETPVKTNADLLTLRGLVSWLEKQDPDGRYDYTNPRDCLLCRYFKDAGFSNVRVNPDVWKTTELIECPLPQYFNEVSNNPMETYGAALKRARALLSTD